MAMKLNEGGDGAPVNERLIEKDANNYDSLLQKRIVAVQQANDLKSQPARDEPGVQGIGYQILQKRQAFSEIFNEEEKKEVFEKIKAPEPKISVSSKQQNDSRLASDSVSVSINNSQRDV